jgi:hypothetical protein
VRGVGQNFGVVTAFPFQSYEQRSLVFAGSLIFLLEKIPQVVKFANKFHNTNDDNQAMLIVFSAPPPANSPVVLCPILHNGNKEEGKTFFAKLWELGSHSKHDRMIPYPRLHSLLKQEVGFEGRELFGDGAF